MTEQERAFWQAVYQQALGAVLASPIGPISEEQVDSCRLFADDAARALRVSERALAAEELASRGEPPFGMGDVVTCKGMNNPTTGTVRVCYWDTERREWLVDLDYGGRLIDRLSAGQTMRKVTP